MATVKILPTNYKKENSSLDVSNSSNLYTDTSSDTYARITHTDTSSGISSVYNFFIRGFEKNKIPEGARVTNYSVKIKIRPTRGGIGNTGIFLCYSTSSPVWNNGSSYSALSDTEILKSNDTFSLDTYTFPTNSISWSTLNQYIQDGSFGICVPVTSYNSQGGGVDIYGAEIEVTYDPPKKYVSDTKLQYFWNKLKTYFSTLLSSSIANWNETDSTALSYIQNKPFIKAGGGTNSIKENYDNTVTGNYAHAEGYETTASNSYAHAENYITIASGECSHAEGYKSIATGQAAHAEGDHTIASGHRSHSEGHKTIASGSSSHAEGQEEAVSLNLSGEANTLTYTFDYTTETDETLFSNLIFSGVVKLIPPNSSNYVTVTNVDKTNKSLTVETTLSTEAVDNVTYTLICCPTASGLASHAEGSSVASGGYSHSEGRYTEASAQTAHAEGYGTKASNVGSHAEGIGTIASNQASHAEGTRTVVSSAASHAEGYETIASGTAAHAEGSKAIASGNFSHAEGQENTVKLALSGDANALTYTFDYVNEGGADYITPFIFSGVVKLIPNNSSSSITVTNVDIENKTLTVDTTLSTEVINNIEYTLTIYPTASGTVSHVEGTSVASGDYTHAEGRYTEASNQAAHAEGYRTTASNQGSHAEGYWTTASGAASHAEGENTTASAEGSHAEGLNTTASALYAHAEGNETIASKAMAHAEGYRTTASGQMSHAEGRGSIASGNNSHAEGYGSVASNGPTHAEGYSTSASGYAAHVEGFGPVSQGRGSHAEGYNTIASGQYAHAEGFFTTASTHGSHSEGYGNIIDLRLTGEANTLVYTYTDTMPFGVVNHLQNNGVIKLTKTANGPWDWNYNQNISGTYSYVNVTAIDTENKTITVDQSLFKEAISNRVCWFILYNTASGVGSHSEGISTIASGQDSHATGIYTVANNMQAIATGEYTIASTRSQTAFGSFNIPDDTTKNSHPSQLDNFGQYAVIVGNGYENATTKEIIRSNAHTLDWQGNGWYAGKLTVGSAPTTNMDVATKQYVDNHVPDLSGYVATSNLATLVNPLIQAALAEYGDGDTATYGYTNVNEEEY